MNAIHCVWRHEEADQLILHVFYAMSLPSPLLVITVSLGFVRRSFRQLVPKVRRTPSEDPFPKGALRGGEQLVKPLTPAARKRGA